MENYRKQTFRIFFDHLKRHKFQGLIVVITTVAGSALGTVPALYYKRFFDILTESGTNISKQDALIQVVVTIFIIWGVNWILWRIANFTSNRFQNNVMVDLAETSFAYLHKHSIEFFNNNFIGSLVKRVNRFSRSFEGLADLFQYAFLNTFSAITVIIVVLFYKNFFLGFVILSWIVIYMVVNYMMSIYKLPYDLKKSVLDSEVTGVLADTITNNQNVKLFTAFNRERSIFHDVNMRLKKLRVFSWDLDQLFESVQTAFMFTLEFIVMYVAIKLYVRGEVTVGDFALLQAYVITIFHQLWNIGKQIRRYYEYLAEADEMTEILVRPHDVVDRKNAKPLAISKGKVQFEGIDFYYRKTRPIIHSVNLTIQSKERVALVGRSGSGKSTLVNLLLRNYDIQKGRILIDEQPVSRATLDSVRDAVSVVNQDTILFHRTLSENIAYGKPGASRKEIEKAAKLAHAHDFIQNFPEGYKTFVGERGVKLSGGERQRIAIARAILKDSPVFVLDEATSSLDSVSEAMIQESLESLMKDRTVIVIAHRLSTIMKMDRIIVLDNGKIVEEGTHETLIRKKKGTYKNLWEKQVGGFID